jgi:hypothetical protein
MRILAVITEPEEVRKILRHLVKIGRSPPGLDPSFVTDSDSYPRFTGVQDQIWRAYGFLLVAKRTERW